MLMCGWLVVLNLVFTIDPKTSNTVFLNQNIPAEALPACENDQNYYILTARSQFLHSKSSKKKRSVYFGNDNPSITSPSKRATATFSHIEDDRA